MYSEQMLEQCVRWFVLLSQIKWGRKMKETFQKVYGKQRNVDSYLFLEKEVDAA